ncbi:MAG: type II toxin-antitoxin system HicB family antitoxin [Gemmatimonadetes bacterium]|nr:type II toxin-antitoxin system HicB family antitoxin [Gemmatimonadota bacterium]
MSLSLAIELECESDHRWLAEVPALPGTLCYGQSRAEAIAHVQALALRVLAERLERAGASGEALTITFHTA